MQREKYLAKNLVLFTFNSIGTRIINFLLVPIYTKVLTTAQYGEADLISTLAVVIVPIITLNIGEAVMRFALDKDANIHNIVDVGILFTFLSLINGIIIFPLMLLFPAIKISSVYVYLFCVTQGLFTTLFCTLRGEEKLFDYALCNILNTFLTAGFNIVFLVVLHNGVEGYFMAYILSYLFASLYAGIKSNIKISLTNFHVDWSLAKQMVIYSIMFVPSNLMWWIINSSDRIMVTSMIGIEQNGIYAISYKLPSVMAALNTIFNQAWMYSAVHEIGSDDNEEFNNKMFYILSRLLFVAIVFLLLILRPFLKIYVSSDYYAAWKYTPYLLVGFYFNTLSTFLSTNYTVHKDSKGFLKTGSLGAVANIILNFILIPIIGVSGAALATCISYFLVFLYAYVDTQKYLKISVFERKNVCIYIIVVMFSIIEFLSSPWYILLLFLGFIVVCFFERKIIKELFSRTLHMLKRH